MLLLLLPLLLLWDQLRLGHIMCFCTVLCLDVLMPAMGYVCDGVWGGGEGVHLSNTAFITWVRVTNPYL